MSESSIFPAAYLFIQAEFKYFPFRPVVHLPPKWHSAPNELTGVQLNNTAAIASVIRSSDLTKGLKMCMHNSLGNSYDFTVLISIIAPRKLDEYVTADHRCTRSKKESRG